MRTAALICLLLAARSVQAAPVQGAIPRDLQPSPKGWNSGGRALERLGRGTVGFVDAHPADPDMVLKTISLQAEQGLFVTPAEAARLDDESARDLENAGVGPRVYESAVLHGRHVSARERVRGVLMSDLAAQGRFGPEEERLVLQMIARMSESESKTFRTDLHPKNVMLGSTARRPERRAYFLDGGLPENFPDGLDAAGRARHLLDVPQAVGLHFDPGSGKLFDRTRTFRSLMDEALIDSRPMTRWGRFKRAAGKLLVEAYLTPTR